MVLVTTLLGCSAVRNVPARDARSLEATIASCRCHAGRVQAEGLRALGPGARAADPFVWRHYDIPQSWDAERADFAIARVLDHVGYGLIHDGWIDTAIVDVAKRTLDVLANDTGHHHVIRALGGCVLYPDVECEDCSIRLVPLEHVSPEDLDAALGPTELPTRRVVSTETGHLIISAPRAIAARMQRLALTADCLVGLTGMSPSRALQAIEDQP